MAILKVCLEASQAALVVEKPTCPMKEMQTRIWCLGCRKIPGGRAWQLHSAGESWTGACRGSKSWTQLERVLTHMQIHYKVNCEVKKSDIKKKLGSDDLSDDWIPYWYNLFYVPFEHTSSLPWEHLCAEEFEAASNTTSWVLLYFHHEEDEESQHLVSHLTLAETLSEAFFVSLFPLYP